MSDSDKIGLIAAYAPKYWDAGNLVVTMMFTLAFAVYLALIQFKEARRLVSKYYGPLLTLAIIGNGLPR